MTQFSVRQKNVTAQARREALLLQNTPLLVSYTHPGTSTVTTASVLAITFDFASAGGYMPGRATRLEIRGRFGAIGGGSAAGMEIKICQPDGNVIATQRVPFGDTAGFSASFLFLNPTDSKYWIYYQAIGVSASPTWTNSEQNIVIEQYGPATVKATI
jgi:hypothetical protein